MHRKLKVTGIIIVALLIIYFLGPAPSSPEWNSITVQVPEDPDALQKYVSDEESRHRLKPGNEAQIIWVDSTRRKTEYALVYLHGFSASQMEGHPVHRQFAQEFGCNLYLARLADHGIDTVEALFNFTTDRYWTSAKEALAVGKALGEKVILMSTSTGSTVALALAAEFPDDVHALINLSPNIAINNDAAFILNNPWGLQIARIVMGGKYREWEASEERKKYWYTKYRLEATVQLEEMLESKMKAETFKKVTQPCLTLYYYNNEEAQDPEVRVSAMLKMHEQLGTHTDLKRAVAIPDAGVHVIGSSLVSKDVEQVRREIERFATEVLQIGKVSVSAELL